MRASVHTVTQISGKSIWVSSDLDIVVHTAKPEHSVLGSERLTMENLKQYSSK